MASQPVDEISAFSQLLPWLLMGMALSGLAVLAFFYGKQTRTLRQFNQKNLFKNLKKLDLLYTLVDNMPDWIYIKDRESKFILVNKHLSRSHGIENPDRMIDTTDFAYYPEDMARVFYEDEQAMMNSGIPIVNKEEMALDKNDHRVVLSTTKIPVKNKSGEVVGIVGIGRDVTRQKETEILLEQLSRVASSTENVVVIMDKDGNFEWVNRGFETRYGYTLEEFVEKNGRNLEDNSSNEDISEILKQIKSTGKAFTYTSRTRDSKGGDAWYQTNITPILDDTGETSSMFLIDSDITRIKKTDLQIKQQKYELESQRDLLKKLNARKDRLFSIIAHDLKNPFQSIIGFAELLQNNHKKLNEQELNDYLECIHSSSTSAYELLFNLLEWARAQIRIIEINPVEIGISELLDDIISLLSLQAKNKQIQFRKQIGQEMNLYADQHMVHTILRNLTSNAIKFTGTGGEVEFSALQKDSNVEISIKDSGIGIPGSKLKNLFSIEKSKSSRGTAGEAGTGLGLLVCKEFLQLNHGKIEVSSVPGSGSTFTITLPVSK